MFLSTLLEDQQLSQKLGNPGWLEWLSQLPLSAEESRKIWRGLSKDEQDGLSAFIKGNYFAIPEPVSILLRTKGLVRKVNNSPCLFSPVFEHFVRNLGVSRLQNQWSCDVS